MSSALVLGSRGSGLTTFVGLLYTAQVRLGTQESDEFRFHAERETIRQLEAIYGELNAGRFPVRDVNWEEHPLSFVLAFRRGVLRGLARAGADDREFDTVHVRVGGMPTEEVAELRAHDAVLASNTRRLFRSEVVVLLVDASSLAPGESGAGSESARADGLLAETLRHLAGFLGAERDRRRRRMSPIVVVTKTDAFSLETLRQLAAPAGLPYEWSTDDRRAFGGRLLRQYFPETGRFFEAAKGGAVAKVTVPEWYFSGLGVTDFDGEARIVRRSLAPVGGWEPEYPFEEYRRLIGQLARLARRGPTESSELLARA